MHKYNYLQFIVWERDSWTPNNYASLLYILLEIFTHVLLFAGADISQKGDMAEGTVVTSPTQHTPPPRPPPPKFTSKTTEDLIVNVSVL